MTTITIKRRRILPFLESKKNRFLFLLINIYLVIGIGGLVITLAYLGSHLNQSDELVKYCIPGFALGISAGIIYSVGFWSLNSDRKMPLNRTHLY